MKLLKLSLIYFYLQQAILFFDYENALRAQVQVSELKVELGPGNISLLRHVLQVMCDHLFQLECLWWEWQWALSIMFIIFN